MNHSEVEDLLAAYAIDAVDPDEAATIEAHLAECGRCRAEVAGHREVAGLLGSSRAEVPPELWERLAAAIAEDTEAAEITHLPARLAGGGNAVPDRARLSRSDRYGARWRRMVLPYGTGALGAAAAAVVVILSLQVSHLNGEVHNIYSASGLSRAVAAAVAGPHQDVTLDSAITGAQAHVVIADGGDAYWVGSSLPSLPGSKTYQLWSSVGGKLISIDLLGANPGEISAFRVDGKVVELLVTVEPEGGSLAPTSSPIVTGAV